MAATTKGNSLQVCCVEGHGSKITRLRVANLCCSGEERIIQKVLGNMRGVLKFSVNILGKHVIVHHCPAQCCSTSEMLVENLNEMRLGVSLQDIGNGMEDGDGEDGNTGNCLWDNGLLVSLVTPSFVGIALQVAGYSSYLYIPCYLICIAVGTLPILDGCYVAIFVRGYLDVKCLVLMAIIGALSIGQYLDTVLVVVLFTLAEKVEEWALDWARTNVNTKKSAVPTKCTKADGTSVPLDSLSIGDIVAYRAGELISMDGNVVKGTGVVDEAALTGEAMPINKKTGSSVLSGTIVQNGYIEVEITELSENSTIQKLQDAMAEVQSERGQMATIIDGVAIYWTPIVLLSAICTFVIATAMTGLWKVWLYRSLALLVLACPCSIVVSAPFPCVIAVALAAKEGVLIKGSSAIERYQSYISLPTNLSIGNLITYLSELRFHFGCDDVL